MPKITVQDVAEAGVVGAGGAGFPTHVKLAARADTLLLNAAECEPLLHKDKEVLRECVDGVIEGMAAAMRLVGAGRAVVGIKVKYDDVIALLRAKLPSGMDVAPLGRRLSGGRRVHPRLRRAGPRGPARRNPPGRGRGGDQRGDGAERRGGRPAAGNGEISFHRRGGGRAGDAARAAGRHLGRVRRCGRRGDRRPTPITWSAA